MAALVGIGRFVLWSAVAPSLSILSMLGTVWLAGPRLLGPLFDRIVQAERTDGKPKKSKKKPKKSKKDK